MRTLGFPCVYLRATDDETESPCGRRATRRKRGEPKCLGHWVVEYLLDMAGGTEHARKTWVIASVAMWVLAVGSTWWLNTRTLPHAITAAALTSGLVICFLWEHPIGGVTCLVFTALIVVVWAWRNYFGFYVLNPDAELPEGLTRMETLFVTSLDVQVAFVFAFSFVGFVAHYYFNSTEARFWRGLSFGLSVLLSVSVMVYAVATEGRSVALVPWVVVLFAALAIAKGGRLARKLAAVLRV